MKIRDIETFILHVPVTRGGISDSTHTISHWGTPGVKITDDAGFVGWGYTGTHANLAGDHAITHLIEFGYGPLIQDRDVEPGEHLWSELYTDPSLQWVGRTGIASLALSAVDIAMWDLKAKHAGVPLWQLLGGSSDKVVRAYDTDGGWLSLTDDELVSEVERKIAEGFPGVKIKVGSDQSGRDIRRVERVRAAIGADAMLMVDVNGRWDLPTALLEAPKFADVDIRWIEEPLWFTDVSGHAALAQRISTPIALGEQLYTTDEFRAFLAADAVHFVQPDAVRLAGITEFLRVAALVHAAHLPVVPHVGDMLPVHTHLAFAHPAIRELEYIPWLLKALEDPICVADGKFVAPCAPGAGTTMTERAMREFRVG